MALALLITTLAVQTVFSQQDIPYCLQTCLTEVGTTLCATHALHDLTPCLAETCANPPATANLIASLDVAFSPKAEYSCQQAYGPSDSEGSTVTLPLNGTCATSPYEFKSYLPQSVSSIRVSVGCGIITFSGEDCLGQAGSSDVGTLSDGKCVFRGGRSARLTCRNELDAARAYMQTNCGTDGEDEEEPDMSSSSSKTVYPSSAPFHGPGPTSSGTDTLSSIPFHWPFSSSPDSAAATSSMPSTSSSIPFHWPFSSSPDSAAATWSVSSTSSSIPFHWPFSSSTGSLTASASSTAASHTVDAAGSSNATANGTAITYSPTGSPASASASAAGNVSASTGGNGNGNSTSPSDGSQNATHTLSPTADPTTLPTFAGLAAQFSGGSKGAAAIALVAAGFALFL